MKYFAKLTTVGLSTLADVHIGPFETFLEAKHYGEKREGPGLRFDNVYIEEPVDPKLLASVRSSLFFGREPPGVPTVGSYAAPLPDPLAPRTFVPVGLPEGERLVLLNRTYRHYRTGDLYTPLQVITDATNGRFDADMILYYSLSKNRLFVREKTEWLGLVDDPSDATKKVERFHLLQGVEPGERLLSFLPAMKVFQDGEWWVAETDDDISCRSRKGQAVALAYALEEIAAKLRGL